MDALHHALQAFARHVKPGGTVVVEPRFEPGTMENARVYRLEFEYLVGGPAGIETRSETHVLGLFTREETETAFAAAGLQVSYDPTGLMGRGLYVGTKN